MPLRSVCVSVWYGSVWLSVLSVCDGLRTLRGVLVNPKLRSTRCVHVSARLPTLGIFTVVAVMCTPWRVDFLAGLLALRLCLVLAVFQSYGIELRSLWTLSRGICIVSFGLCAFGLRDVSTVFGAIRVIYVRA